MTGRHNLLTAFVVHTQLFSTMEERRKRDRSKKKHKYTRDSIASDEASKNDKSDDRRRAKVIRSAEKHAERMAELGLDVNGEPLDNYSLSQYPVREYKLSIRGFQDHVAINPIVNVIAIICLWSVVVWTKCDPVGSMERLTAWSTQIVLQLSWLVQSSSAVSFFFVFYLLYKYGHLRLGRCADEKPEFSLLTAVAMLVASATGPGILVFSVNGPLLQAYDNFFVQPGYRSQDEVDLFAVNLTIFRWGIMCWTHICVVAVALSLAAHRFGLPLTLRSCFYPILGAYTWGWMGDVIDAIALVSAVAAACATTTFACFQIVVGMVYLGWVDRTKEDIGLTMVLTMWIVTITSTASVISGLRGGVRFFSRLAFGLALSVLLLVFLMDDTKFLLNLQVQEIGYHVQTSLFQMNFWTDAFGQLKAGSGRAVDGGASAEDWYSTYAIVFYAGISASGVFGMLCAHVCRGRKLWELVMLALVVPIWFTILWFCTLGGAGLRQTRQAKEMQLLGATYYNNSAHFMVDGSDLCYDVPQHDVVMDQNTTIFTNHLLGVTPVCQFDNSTIGYQTNVLHMLDSFRFPETFGNDIAGFGPFLVALYSLACALNLVASSDSSSLMVDALASNARKNYHWLRRLFWAGTVGILTTALLSLGGEVFQQAIESFIVVVTVPKLLLMCLVLHPTLLLCQAADQDPDCRQGDYLVASSQLLQSSTLQLPQIDFATPLYGGVWNWMEYAVSMGQVHSARIERGMDRGTPFHAIEFVKGLVVPFVSLQQLLRTHYPNQAKTNALIVTLYTLCFLAWFVLWVASSWSIPSLHGLSMALWVIHGGILATVRGTFRARYHVRSNVVADFIGSMILWPQVLVQLREHGVNATNNTATVPCDASMATTEKSTKLQHDRVDKELDEAGNGDSDEESA